MATVGPQPPGCGGPKYSAHAPYSFSAGCGRKQIDCALATLRREGGALRTKGAENWAVSWMKSERARACGAQTSNASCGPPAGRGSRPARPCWGAKSLKYFKSKPGFEVPNQSSHPFIPRGNATENRWHGGSSVRVEPHSSRNADRRRTFHWPKPTRRNPRCRRSTARPRCRSGNPGRANGYKESPGDFQGGCESPLNVLFAYFLPHSRK